MMPILLPARRDAYLRALNELVGYLSMQTFKQLNVANFCVMHGVKGDFLTALRDLDALELDLAKLAVQGETWYKRTPSLLDFTPEDVVAQMQRNLVDCSADVVAISVKVDGEEIAPTKGVWIRFFDSRTNEFIADDLSDTRVADDEPAVIEPIRSIHDDPNHQLQEIATVCNQAAFYLMQLAGRLQKFEGDAKSALSTLSSTFSTLNSVFNG